jgi:hypothetical protein
MSFRAKTMANRSGFGSGLMEINVLIDSKLEVTASKLLYGSS